MGVGVGGVGVGVGVGVGELKLKLELELELELELVELNYLVQVPVCVLANSSKLHNPTPQVQKQLGLLQKLGV